jgi:flagellar motor switch protein FliG
MEHPQTIALVLSHLSPDFASAILDSIDEGVVAEIGVRLATLDQVTSTSLARVEAGIRERLSPVLENRFLEVTGGTDTLVELLTRLDKSLQEKVIDGLNSVDPELGKEVKNKLFVFDDMRILDDRQIQMVLRNVDANRLPMALKGVDPVVRDLFLNNLSSRARENLVDEMGLMGSVRIAEVEEAQAEILAVVASLEESGELVINRGGADFVS